MRTWPDVHAAVVLQAREWYREDLVGEAVARSGLPRETLFITTKVHPSNLGYWSTLRAVDASLKDLRTSYIDLVLLHYPDCWGSLCTAGPPEGGWRDRRASRIAAVGVPVCRGVPELLARPAGALALLPGPPTTIHPPTLT